MNGNSILRRSRPDKTDAEVAIENALIFQKRGPEKKSLEAIAAEMTAEGYPMGKDTVARRLKSEVERRVGPHRDEFIAIELEKLERIEETYWPKSANGDYKATDKILDAMDRRAKFLALYAPIESRVDMRLSAADTEINQWMPPTEDAPDDPNVIEGVVVDE